jgi:RNA polymerase sigma-70 factor, ECF subfamily
MESKNQHIEIDNTELEAMENLRRGSAEAFQILYKKYNQRIYRFCLKMLGDTTTAQDAFQETFISVYEHRMEFRSNNFAAWIYQISRRTCLNILRTKKEYESYNDEDHSSSGHNITDVGLKSQIDFALSKLPDGMREAVILREYEDCSYQDIAEVLNIDISLAKVRVHRARIILRKILQPLIKEYYES